MAVLALCLGASLVAGGCGQAGTPDASSGAPGSETGRAGDRPGETAPPAEPVRPDEVLEGTWSPDGYRLAVTWDRGPGARLYGLLAGTDSTPPDAGRGLPLSPGRGAWAAWSPDGLWIAYGSGGNLHRMRPDGTQDEVLTTGSSLDDHPAYAPDGRRIAFVSRMAGGEEAGLWTMSADGSDRRRVPLPLRGSWRAPAWHPGGEALAAELATDQGTAVYRVDPDRGSAVRLAAGRAPAFSPSGDTLYFSRDDSVFRMGWPVAEGAAREDGDAIVSPGLVVAPGWAPHPAPDGRRLAFVRGSPPRSALYLLDLTSGDTLRVTSELPPRPPRPGG